MDELGKREARWAVQLGRERAGEAWEAATAAAYFAQLAVRASYCALTGRHRWQEWRRSSSGFVPAETRACRRCTAREHRGDWPEIRVEMGSLS
jgi:hypothetical protein